MVIFMGTTTVLMVDPLFVAAKGLVPTIVPLYVRLSFVATIEYVAKGMVVPAAAWN